MTQFRFKRTVVCPQCGERVKIPLAWIVGVEMIFRCTNPECKQTFRTGFKMGAVLFGLALTLALVSVNLLIFLFSSLSLPVMVLLIVPLWVAYGYVMRLAYLKFRLRNRSK